MNEMRKYKSSYGKPYIRKITPKDRENTNCDFTTFIAMSFNSTKYVIVQRGINGICACGKSKQQLKRSILVVNKNKHFNKWANRIKKRVQK